MKNGLFTIMSLGLLFMLNGCLKDSDEGNRFIWYSYGTYYDTEDNIEGFFINLDTGKKLIPDEVLMMDSNIMDSSRVFVQYYENTSTNEQINADIDDIIQILTKDIIQLTEENKDSIGNDGILLDKTGVWITENHINVGFSYYGYSGGHYINLVKPIGEQFDNNGHQILELRHNDNDDAKTYVNNAVVAFNLQKLHKPGTDSLTFTLRWFDYFGDTANMNATFYFNTTEQNSTKTAFENKDFTKDIY